MNIPSTIALKMTQKANEAVAKATKHIADRFIAVGTSPILSEEFMAEFDRCIGELDMVGIQIFSNTGSLFK
jgi:predicted TIM-barrel fold metal-dependent hydrolase